MLFAGNQPLPVLVNGVFRTDRRRATQRRCCRARTRSSPHADAAGVLCRAHADADLATAPPGRRVCWQFGDSPAMVLEQRSSDLAPPSA